MRYSESTAFLVIRASSCIAHDASYRGNVSCKRALSLRTVVKLPFLMASINAVNILSSCAAMGLCVVMLRSV